MCPPVYRKYLGFGSWADTQVRPYSPSPYKMLPDFPNVLKWRIAHAIINSTNRNLKKERNHMKRQLQGIALILFSLLLMLGYGGAHFFDLSFRWSLVFSVIGMIGVIIAFLPDKKN